VTEPEVAQRVPWSNFSSPLEAVADMRATAKWIIAALAAVGAALVGGGPLTAVGRIHAFGPALVAVAGLVISLAGIGWAIWHTAEALMPLATTLAMLDTPELATLQKQIKEDPRAFFGPFGQSVPQLEAAGDFWDVAAANASVMLAKQTDHIRRQVLIQGLADARANAAQARARLYWLLEVANAWRVRDQLRRARAHAFAGATLASIGAVLFVFAASAKV
jgi:hypothetical protein